MAPGAGMAGAIFLTLNMKMRSRSAKQTYARTGPRRLVAAGIVAILLCGSADRATAADPGQIFSNVQQQVAAKPGNAGAILQRELHALPPAEWQRLAAGIFAATLAGLDKPNSAKVRALFKIAVEASPRSAVALLEVAFRADPSSLLEFTRIAIAAVRAAGMPELIPAIVARAVELSPEQRAALTQLALAGAPPALARAILDAIVAALANRGGGKSGLGVLGGSINPANIGGSVVSPEQ
jgi:hypothetical protein